MVNFFCFLWTKKSSTFWHFTGSELYLSEQVLRDIWTYAVHSSTCHDRCSRIFNKLYRKLYVWVKTMLLHHRIWSEPVINLGWGNSLRKEWFIDKHLRKGVLWKRIFFEMCFMIGLTILKSSIFDPRMN